MDTDAERPVVLIVDDEPANIDLLRDALQPGYRVKAATNGERALTIARKTPAPDLILLDAMMPGLDGYAVCARLQQAPETATIPVIFVSSSASAAEQARARELGARDYLQKPVKSEDLQASLQRVLGGGTA